PPQRLTCCTAQRPSPARPGGALCATGSGADLPLVVGVLGQSDGAGGAPVRPSGLETCGRLVVAFRLDLVELDPRVFRDGLEDLFVEVFDFLVDLLDDRVAHQRLDVVGVAVVEGVGEGFCGFLRGAALAAAAQCDDQHDDEKDDERARAAENPWQCASLRLAEALLRVAARWETSLLRILLVGTLRLVAAELGIRLGLTGGRTVLWRLAAVRVGLLWIVRERPVRARRLRHGVVFPSVVNSDIGETGECTTWIHPIRRSSAVFALFRASASIDVSFGPVCGLLTGVAGEEALGGYSLQTSHSSSTFFTSGMAAGVPSSAVAVKCAMASPSPRISIRSTSIMASSGTPSNAARSKVPVRSRSSTSCRCESHISALMSSASRSLKAS